jgi:hypothetical protein
VPLASGTKFPETARLQGKLHPMLQPEVIKFTPNRTNELLLLSRIKYRFSGRNCSIFVFATLACFPSYVSFCHWRVAELMLWAVLCVRDAEF